MVGWYCFFNTTPCQFLLRFVFIINEYLGTAVLVCMTACDIVPIVRVAN